MKMLEEEESRFGPQIGKPKVDEESDEEGQRTTFADLLGDSKQVDVPSFDDLLGK